MILQFHIPDLSYPIYLDLRVKNSQNASVALSTLSVYQIQFGIKFNYAIGLFS